MTPQQANELLRTFAQRIIDMNVQYALDKYGNAKKADTMSCVTLARQALADTANCAPAPTEPAVDRDAAAYTCIGKGGVYRYLCGAVGAGGARDLPEMTVYQDAATGALYFRTHEDFAERMKGIATPAPTAVPEPAPLAPMQPDNSEVPYLIVFDDTERENELVIGDWRAAIRFKQVSASWNAHLFVRIAGNSHDDKTPCYQASQPTSAGGFSGVNIDRVHHIMDGYTPKPPPPRPQRPPGPLWTDAERERFRENMKRGERCPICSVIEGGQHFPGCSRGVP